LLEEIKAAIPLFFFLAFMIGTIFSDRRFKKSDTETSSKTIKKPQHCCGFRGV
jgi:hypothetical protein